MQSSALLVLLICAISASARLYSWGDNAYGQLGAGWAASRYLLGSVDHPALVNKTITKITSGFGSHVLVITSNGEVYGWGRNIKGELGDSTTQSHATAIRINSTLFEGERIIDVAAGREHSLFLTASGRVLACGDNYNGQLGDGTVIERRSPVLVMSDGFIAGKRTVKVVAARSHSLAITEDGMLYAWGWNAYGQLGDDSFEDSMTPVKVSIPSDKRVIDVSGGRLHSIALTSDNMVYTWGSNRNGQLGDGTTFDHRMPINISFAHLEPVPGLIKKVVAGKYFSLVLTEAGDLITFGDNAHGQLGDGTVQLGIDPKYMPRTNVLFERQFVDVAAGYEHVIVRTDDSRIFSWGRNSFGQLGDSTTTERHLPQPFIIVEHVSNIRFADIAATLYGSIVRTVGGRMYSCGDNRFGQLGDGSRYTSQPSKPVRVSLSNNCGSVSSLNVISVDGRDHSVLALSNGRVYAWGQNDLAEIGDGSTINKMSPTETDSTGVLANQRVIKVSAGYDHTLALTDTGRIYAWGNNQEGQLGDGTEVSRVTPVLVDMTAMIGKRVITTDAGTSHSVAITDDGRLYAWGRNYEGQIGTGSRPPAYTSPVEIVVTEDLVGKKFVAVTAGSYFTLALTDSNELFAWGDNSFGQLGIGNRLSQSTAVKVDSEVLGNKTIVQIAAGRRHSMILTADNVIYAWGSNSMGQIGDGTFETRTLPTPVNQADALKNVKISKIDTGYEHSLVLAADGRIYGWGDNEFYQLGVSDRVQIPNPIAMPLQGDLRNKRVKIIEGGDGHTLVLTRIFVSEMKDFIGDTAELLVISGSEFGTTRTDVTVELNQGTCAIRSVTENTITCVVSNLVVGPLYARVFVLDEDSGEPVQVRTVVPAPSITPSSSIITQDAKILFIFGQGFDPKATSNSVTLFLGRQSLDCVVINGTANQLVCEMQEELGSLGTLMAQIRSFNATSTAVAVAEVTLPVWGLTLVLIATAGCVALMIFFGVRYYRSVKQKKRFEEWQANFQSKYVVPRNEIFPPVTLEWVQPETSVNTPLDDFPIKFSKSHLDFGNSGYPFRLNVTYKDAINLQLKRLVARSKPTKGTHATMLALEDIGSDLKQSLLASASNKGVRVVFHAPQSHKFKLIMPNNEFSLTKGNQEVAEFDLMVFMTTQCAVPIAIEIPDWNMHTYIELNVVGELSPYIDFDEVKFDKTKMIGDGAFGTVYQGVYRNQQVAVKVLKIQELLPAFMDEYFREIDLLNKLRHPNIVQFVGASTVEGRLAILTEFIELGSAKNYLSDDLELYVRMRVALDTAKAIQFLHQNKIMHRDIKLENLLVVSLDRNAPVVVKLTDFGTSRAIAEELAQRYTMGIGTPIFMAPEMLLKQPYDLKSDIYSFGMLLWTLYSQKEPYETFERTWDVVPFVIQGNREKIPESCPSDLRALIESCWDQDPKQRPAIDTIVLRLEAFVNSIK